MGEGYLEPHNPNGEVQELGLEESHFFDFECISPRLDEAPRKPESHLDTPVMITAETGNMSFENMVKLTKERIKQMEDIESANEMTNEVTEDQDLRIPVKQSTPQKSRFNKAPSIEAKPQNSLNGVSLAKTTRRRSSRPKVPKSSTVNSEEGSTSPKGISLAKRKDVVNKTLLRSVKRYYTSLFEQFTKENLYTKQERREFWKAYISEFTKSIFGDYMSTITPESGITLEEVNAFMSAMIVPNNIKRSECEEVYNLMMEEFSNLLYKYSIKRLGSFVRNPSVKFVLRHYVELGPLRDLLENDVTLSKNKSLYLRASKEILNINM